MNVDNLRGCGTALITPFLVGGELDEVALARLVDRQLAAGIDFLVPCGTTGETPTLTLAEQSRVIEIVVRLAGGRVPIVAGAGGNNTRQVIETASRWAALGVDALLSVTPYYSRPSQEGLARHYAALADAIDLPVILYNVPGRTGVSLAVETVLRLAEIPGVIGIKEASGSLERIMQLACQKPDGFSLLSGDDAAVLPLIAAGGEGLISVTSNLVPRDMVELTWHCLEGRFAEARQLQPRLLALAAACFFETNPVPIKAALAMSGLIEEVYRLPLVPLADENRRALAMALNSAGLEQRLSVGVSVRGEATRC